LSGVQVDHSPAVATRSLDISSWNEPDLSTLTSSGRKSYYRRKSAIQDYFTTGESLSQIASRYHLPVRVLEKLTKKCEMRHEDGTPWGYRALVPGITVIDHTSTPEPASEPEPASTSANDAALVEADDKTDDNGEKDADRGMDADDRVDADGRPDADGEADAMNRVPTEPAADDDVVGTRFIASAASSVPASDNNDNATSSTAGADDAEADDNDDATREGGADDDTDTDTRDDNTAIPAVSTGDSDMDTTGVREAFKADDEPEPVIQPEPVILSAAKNPSSADERFFAALRMTGEAEDDRPENLDAQLAPVGMDTLPSSLDDTSTEDDGDTAPRRAIVLTRQDPVATDDMPDMSGGEETSTGAEDQAEGHVEVETYTPLPDVPEGDSGEFYMPELATSASRSLVIYERMLPAALPRTSKKHIAIRGLDKRTAIAKRSIRRRWMRSVERTHKRRSYRLIGGAVAAVMLLSLLIPLGAGIAAYSAYNSIKGIALDGVSHLLDVKTLLPVSKSNPTAVLNPVKLQQANADFTQAGSDFLQLQQLINRQDIQNMVQQFAPQYSSKLGMAQRLVQVGIDVTRMGNELIGVAMLGANILHGSPLASGSTKPLITVDDVSNIEGTMLHALYYIQDIKTQMSQVVLNQLPLSAAQQKEITSAMTLLPKAQNYIEQGQGMIGIVSWLLGVGQARHFLVQTMDQAELRPGGGFTGQYGVFTIQDGRMAPFTLQDVTELDYNGNGSEFGRQAPPAYASWMNFGNFGLRDSNLSGDFPTTAQLAMQVFEQEGGGPVDGDIAFTPTAIEHVLDVIGPLKIPAYNETITAQNLEDKLHYYQNDPAAIALQREKTGTHNAATRKSFTALVGSTLLSTVRHLPIATLMKIAQNATKDIQSRDLEIYFTNPQAEGWLVTHSFSGAMSTFSNTDGFMVVQSNISISKASDDVQTTEQDNIVLDAQGGATHNLTITLDYQGTKPIYSVYTTYADYIRVYAPANAVLEGGDGFDTGKALCSPVATGTTGTGNPGKTKQPPTPNPNPGLPPCSQFSKTYGSNSLYCPDGNYNLGPRGWIESKGYSNWAIDETGGPTELTSDLPGRAMWGGLTVTPKNCISTITLSWYVPNAVKHVVGQPLYSVLVQKQGGYIPQVQISIDTSQLKGVKPYSFSGGISADRLFSLAVVKKGR
jgi:hypothetical protein